MSLLYTMAGTVASRPDAVLDAELEKIVGGEVSSGIRRGFTLFFWVLVVCVVFLVVWFYFKSMVVPAVPSTTLSTTTTVPSNTSTTLQSYPFVDGVSELNHNYLVCAF